LKNFRVILLFALCSIVAGAQNINFSNTTPAPPGGYTNVQWQHDTSNPVNISAYFALWSVAPGTGAPSAPCSSVINVNAFYTNATLELYQCSNATGTYQWNLLQGSAASDVTVALRTAPAANSGGQQAYDAIPSVTPVCDIRAWGAHIDGTTPIDSAVQACINVIGAQYGATGDILLPCIRPSGGAGCLLNNSSTLTAPSSGYTIRFKLQGGLALGSTLVAYSWGSWYGEGGGVPGQFQTNTVPASIAGPQVYGSLITAITSANTATNINIGFGAGTIANLPVGSAITIAGQRSSTGATAARVAYYSIGEVTLSLASSLRPAPGSRLTVSNCVDSSFNITGGAVANVDYAAGTITYFQNDATPATTTGCTATAFVQDKFESARILCSNGSAGTFNGVTYSSCGAGQVTVMTKFTHSGTDLWGAVAVAPAFNNYTPQTFSDLQAYNCQGACFWSEGGALLTLNHVEAQANATATSVAMELTANYLSQFHDIYAQANSIGGVCSGGGCGQPSDPYALICDSDAPVGAYYSSTSEACNSSTFDQSPWFYGGILLGDGLNQINGLPVIIGPTFEEAWGNAVTIDNRSLISSSNWLRVVDSYVQDSVSDSPQYLLDYTDSEIPTGTVEVDNFQTFATSYLAGPHFNGDCILNAVSTGTTGCGTSNLNSSSGFVNGGNNIRTEVQNEGAHFAPSIIPYASLPMTSYSASAWNALCVTAGTCTATAVVGPDGPNGQMVAAEVDATASAADIVIGTDTRATYAGDHYLIGSWVRPGEGNSFTTGNIGNFTGNNNGFYLNAGSSIQFAPTFGTGTVGTHACAPAAFGPKLANNGWAPEVAICTINVGYSSSFGYTFHLAASNGGSGTKGNQYAEPFWVFIPGPNNPACTAAGTCNLTADQIEEARRDQYHGFVPPGMSAGAAATGEPIQTASSVTANGVNNTATGCNGTNPYVEYNGGCGPGATGGGTVTHTAGALTQYSMMMGNGSADSAVTNITTDSSLNNLNVPGSISSAPASGNAGIFSIACNTANPTLITQRFNLLGCPTAPGSVTAFAWQVPSATNSSAGLLHVGAQSSNISQLSVSLVAIADLSASGSPSSTTFLRGDNTWATPSGSGNMNDGSGTATAGQFAITSTTAHVYTIDTNLDDGYTAANTLTYAGTNGVNASGGPIAGTKGYFGSPSSAAKAALPSGANGMSEDETTTAGVPASAVDYLRADATAHCLEASFNNSAESCLVTLAATQTLSNKTIASGNLTGTTNSGVLYLTPQGTATSGANFNSYSLNLQASYWNGSAATPDYWSLTNTVGSGTNPASQLQFNHSGSSGGGSILMSQPLYLGGHLNQSSSGTIAGTCSIAAVGTSCTSTLSSAFTNTPVCIATAQTSSLSVANSLGCTVSGTTVTITSYVAFSASVSTTVGWLVIGNPN